MNNSYDEEEVTSRLKNIFGEDDKPISAVSFEEKIVMNNEDKQKIRKQVLIGIFIVFVIGVVLVFFYTKMIFSGNNNEQNNIPSIQRPIIESELLNGNLDINSNTVKNINSIFNFDSSNPLYSDNILNLYQGTVRVSEVDLSTKMFLITSSNAFKNMMEANTKIKNYDPTTSINLSINLNKELLNEISYDILDEKFETLPESFTYSYRINDKTSLVFNAILSEGEYIFEPIDIVNPEVLVYSKLESALKQDNDFYIQYRTIFVNDKGIYSDPAMTNYLGKDVIKMNEYLKNSNIYNFIYSRVFDKDNTPKYYLKKIELGIASVE